MSSLPKQALDILRLDGFKLCLQIPDRDLPKAAKSLQCQVIMALEIGMWSRWIWLTSTKKSIA